VDQFGVEVLNARYLNKRAIWINAVLRYPGTAPIIIRGSQSSEANCIFGSGKADIAIE
jgi:hypothetical protein